MGGGRYYAPVQKAGDFLEGDACYTKRKKVTDNLAATYKPGTRFAELKDCLPEYVSESIREGINVFSMKTKFFGDKEAILTGIETRSSSPVRIIRNDNGEPVNTKGLYPCGEGAGYAGGIISAAVDGIVCAEKVIQEYRI